MPFVGELVQTPYGPAKIRSLRDDHSLVLTPLIWRLASKQEPYFYMTPNVVNSYFFLNDYVKTQYGTGNIVSIRESDGVYIVILDNWHLANGKSPVLYLQPESIQLIKAAPRNIVEQAVAAVEQIAVTISHEVETTVEKISEIVHEAAAPIVEEAKTIIEHVVETSQEVVAEAEEKAAPVVHEISHQVETLAEQATEAVHEAVTAATEATAPIVEHASEVIHEAVTAATEATTQATEAVHEAVAAAAEAAAPIVEEASKVAEKVVEAAHEAVVAVEEATGLATPSKFHVGDHIMSLYGRGVVRQIRSPTSIVVEPSDWLLANSKAPIFYLNTESAILESEYLASQSQTTETTTNTQTADDKSAATTTTSATEGNAAAASSSAEPNKKKCIIS